MGGVGGWVVGMEIVWVVWVGGRVIMVWVVVGLRADMWVGIAGAWVWGFWGGAEIDFGGVFWGVCACFGGGWYGYTGKSFLPLYGH